MEVLNISLLTTPISSQKLLEFNQLTINNGVLYREIIET